MTPEVEAALEWSKASVGVMRDNPNTTCGYMRVLADEVRAQAEKRCETCAHYVGRRGICAELGDGEYDVTPEQVNHTCGVWKRLEAGAMFVHVALSAAEKRPGPDYGL